MFLYEDINPVRNCLKAVIQQYLVFHCLGIQEQSFHVVLMHAHILIRACTHTEQKTRKHGFKKPKYDINKAEGAELGNATPCANRLCTHPFVKTDLWIVYHILKAPFFSSFINLSQNSLIKVPITISCTTKLWYVKLQTRKNWNHKFLQY